MNLISGYFMLFLLAFVLTELVSCEDDYHTILGKAIYIPEEDLLGSIPNGLTFFRDIEEHCQRKLKIATTAKDQTYYRNTEDFYKSIATETNLKAGYEGPFSLGLTLDITSKSISGTSREVSGTSINLATKAFVQQFSPNCLYTASLGSSVVRDFAALPTQIKNPWHKSSWREYHHFLERHGSHVITSVTFGSSIDQYAFAETKSSFSSKQFTVKACASLGAGVGPGKLSLSACSGVTKAVKKLSNSQMSTSVVVRGGSVNLRNRLLYDRSSDLIIQFLTEGHTHPTPIAYTLTPIWEILRRHHTLTSENKNTYVQAVNLEYYFDGYLNFGCPYQPSKRPGTPPIQKFDYASHSTSSNPVFQCSLASQGCHHDNDCRYQIGVKCECRGSSCIRHGQTKLPNGKSRATASPHYQRRWSWNGCDWKLWGSRCACRHPNPTRRIIF
ncbi:DELTA-alicitoxin-Pse2a-like [Dendronephthya gigantea]|uniref:DELTA-alicitoxin-Pse2a-like n=1 Tax=Dendronephthya gigantea TaxID=151771 RepID=UPI00106A6F6A|nr:DELTA-alicitoxin-Pse2a-like [Dendronephthya gigantea]